MMRMTNCFFCTAPIKTVKNERTGEIFIDTTAGSSIGVTSSSAPSSPSSSDASTGPTQSDDVTDFSRAGLGEMEQAESDGIVMFREQNAETEAAGGDFHQPNSAINIMGIEVADVFDSISGSGVLDNIPESEDNIRW